MVYSKDKLQLSTTVGQGKIYILFALQMHIVLCAVLAGESGLVYKAYLNTAVGKELVAVKTVKGTLLYPAHQ